MRAISCLFNKRTGKANYYRSGILGSTFNENSLKFNIADIVRLEMKRHINRYGDTFQIILALNDSHRLPLSAKNLGFEECQRYAEKIREFLELKAPVKAVD